MKIKSQVCSKNQAPKNHRKKGQGLVEFIMLLSMVMAIITGLAFFNSPKFRAELYNIYAKAILKPLPQNGSPNAPSDPFFNINNDL